MLIYLFKQYLRKYSSVTNDINSSINNNDNNTSTVMRDENRDNRNYENVILEGFSIINDSLSKIEKGKLLIAKGIRDMGDEMDRIDDLNVELRNQIKLLEEKNSNLERQLLLARKNLEDREIELNKLKELLKDSNVSVESVLVEMSKLDKEVDKVVDNVVDNIVDKGKVVAVNNDTVNNDKESTLLDVDVKKSVGKKLECKKEGDIKKEVKKEGKKSVPKEVEMGFFKYVFACIKSSICMRLFLASRIYLFCSDEYLSRFKEKYYEFSSRIEQYEWRQAERERKKFIEKRREKARRKEEKRLEKEKIRQDKMLEKEVKQPINQSVNAKSVESVKSVKVESESDESYYYIPKHIDPEKLAEVKRDVNLRDRVTDRINKGYKNEPYMAEVEYLKLRHNLEAASKSGSKILSLRARNRVIMLCFYLGVFTAIVHAYVEGWPVIIWPPYNDILLDENTLIRRSIRWFIEDFIAKKCLGFDLIPYDERCGNDTLHIDYMYRYPPRWYKPRPKPTEEEKKSETSETSDTPDVPSDIDV